MNMVFTRSIVLLVFLYSSSVSSEPTGSNLLGKLSKGASEEYLPSLDPKDVAFGKYSLQSTTYWNRTAIGAVDGFKSTCSITHSDTEPSWWGVDLEKKYHIGSIYLHSQVQREKRLKRGKMYIFVTNDVPYETCVIPDPLVYDVCWSSDEISYNVEFEEEITCAEGLNSSSYRYLFVWVPAWHNLAICDLRVYEDKDTFTKATSSASQAYSWLGKISVLLMLTHTLRP